MIVTKVGARRGEDKSWIHALSRQELTDAVHDNLRNLGLDSAGCRQSSGRRSHGPSEGSIEEPLTVLAELKRQGLIRHLGLSNVSCRAVGGGSDHYRDRLRAELLQRGTPDDDGFIDDLAAQGIAYVPFFPLGGFTPLQSSALDAAAASTGGHADAGRAGVASSALAQHPADPRHIIRRTSSRESQCCDAATSAEMIADLDSIGGDTQSVSKRMSPNAL